MTPFARMEPMMLKRAGTQPFPFAPQYQPGRVPTPIDPTAAPDPTGKPPGYIHHPGKIDNFWGDLAVSSIPIAGSAYMANNAIGNFRNGEWGSGIGNLAFAGLSLIPGVGAVGGALKGVGKGGMAMLKGGLKGMRTMGPLGLKGTLGVTAGGIAAPMMLDPSRPQQQQPMMPNNQDAAPMDFFTSTAESMRNRGLSAQ